MSDETKRDLTTTEYIILGLVSTNPQTGYGIIATLEHVSSRWSTSSGSIYPALKRMEKQGLISGMVEMIHETRARKVFRITPEGEEALDAWLRSPLSPAEVLDERETALVKFLFAEKRLTRQEILTWLDAYDTAAIAYRDAHRDWHNAMLNISSVHQQVFLEASMMELNMQRAWIQMARERLQSEIATTPVVEAALAVTPN